jgi:hypothetical protein
MSGFAGWDCCERAQRIQKLILRSLRSFSASSSKLDKIGLPIHRSTAIHDSSTGGALSSHQVSACSLVEDGTACDPLNS